MAISPDLTFICDFKVQTHLPVDPAEPASVKCGESGDVVSNVGLAGEGSGRASCGESQGLFGPSPRFELSGSWLTVFPSEGCFRSLPSRFFSDAEVRQPVDCDAASFLSDRKEAQEIVWRSLGSIESVKHIVMHPNSQMRDLASYSINVGGALLQLLRVGDELTFSSTGGDFYYAVRRNTRTIFSAGSITSADGGEELAVWQEYDRVPNPNANTLPPELKHRLGVPAEWIPVHRTYVTVRVKDKLCRLLDGEEVHIDPYYVYLARSNQNVPVLSFGFTPRAVHAAGRLDIIDKDFIIAAARQLTRPNTKLL